MDTRFKSPDTAAFRVVNADEIRTDLALRREVKFASREVDVSKLRSLLAGNLRRQIHNDRVSTVRSVYFDDAALSCCRANHSGLSSRRKLRVRWYDSPLPDTSFFIEVKWRENQITGKRRWQIETEKPLTEFSFSEISRQIAECVGEGDRILAWQLTEPVVLIEYRREHFVSTGGDVRFTLDYNLRFTDQTGRTRITSRFATDATGVVVIEGKFPHDRDPELRQLLHPLAPRLTSSSKYVLGCETLGLVK